MSLGARRARWSKARTPPELGAILTPSGSKFAQKFIFDFSCASSVLYLVGLGLLENQGDSCDWTTRSR
ncbi:hypothetical protein JCGZ_26610 [Jatropha curcas]|uniref:Uncharacterized protein n=1 Tax=Jatropha curcas TaxID=180498 RepID=A0A067JK68_JATCU|nr:hypothetical protein JCGZ_26610 [Jatropha curcas]